MLYSPPLHALLALQAPEAVANKAIKAAAAKLEREEMAASPSHSMRKRDEGGLASAVQVMGAGGGGEASSIKPMEWRRPWKGRGKPRPGGSFAARCNGCGCAGQWPAALMPPAPHAHAPVALRARMRQEVAQHTARPDMNPVVKEASCRAGRAVGRAVARDLRLAPAAGQGAVSAPLLRLLCCLQVQERVKEMQPVE